MYEDMYKDYSNTCFEYSYPITFAKCNKEYLRTHPPVRLTWFYGNSIELRFNLIAEDESEIPEYFANKEIHIKFYNFRRECILDYTFTSSDIQLDEDIYFVVLNIDSKTSLKYFKSDLYYCGVDVIDNVGDIETLLYYDFYTIMVK